jgi:WD40 repeat protein
MSQPTLFCRPVTDLVSMGVKPECIHEDFITMESNKCVCVCDCQISIFDTDMAQQPKSPIFMESATESAIINPVAKVIALKNGASIQIFDLELNVVIKSHDMPEPVAFWKWVSPTVIGIVSSNAVLHWTYDGDSPPSMIFPLKERLIGAKIIDYRVCHSISWCCLIGISTSSDESDTDNRVMQIFEIESSKVQSDNYQIIEGDTCSFDLFTLEGNTEASTLFAFGSIFKSESLKRHVVRINIVDIHAVCQETKRKLSGERSCGGARKTFKKELDFASDRLPVEPRQFVVSLRISKCGLCFVVTNLGFVLVFDIETEAPVCEFIFSAHPVFMGCSDSFGGIHCINVKGQIFALNVAKGDASDIIPYLNMFKLTQVALKLTDRVQGFGTIAEDGIELQYETRVGMSKSDKRDLVADRYSNIFTFRRFPKFQHGSAVKLICFFPCGYTIVTCTKDCFRFFDVVTGNEIRKAIEHEESDSIACFVCDGKRIVSSSRDGYTSIFDISTGEKKTMEKIEIEADVSAVRLSPDGNRIVTVSHDDKFARIFEVDTGKMIFEIEHGVDHTDVDRFLRAMCFSPDGQRVAALSSGILRIYDIATKRVILGHKFKKDLTFAPLCFSPDGQRIAIVTHDRDESIVIFHDFTGRWIQRIRSKKTISTVCFSLDGKRLVIGEKSWSWSSDEPKCFHIIDIASGNELHTIDGARGSFCFSPDALYMATIQDSIVHLMNLKHHVSLLTLKTFIRKERNLSLFCFSPDGTMIAVCERLSQAERNFVRVMNFATGNMILKIDHGDVVDSCVFSPDAKMIATCNDRIACIFDVATGMRIMPTALNGRMVASVMFGPDGDRRVSGNWDIFKHMADVVSGATILNETDDKKNFPIPTSLVLTTLAGAVSRWRPFSDDQVMFSEFFSADGAGLVALASRWQINAAQLKRFFEKEYPVINAGLILRNLLATKPDSNVLPDSAIIEALFRNISKYARFASRDSVLTQQLACAARIPCLRSIVGSFWSEMVQLEPSPSITIHNVSHISFSETTRMYVAASNSTVVPVFESFFNKFPLVDGPKAEFEHLFVPFCNASNSDEGKYVGSFADLTDLNVCQKRLQKQHEFLSPSTSKAKQRSSRDIFSLYLEEDNCQTKQVVPPSLLAALVDTDNIDIFGSPVVRSIVQFKWQAFGLKHWLAECFKYAWSLLLLVALSTCHWELQSDHQSPIGVVDPKVQVSIEMTLMQALFSTSIIEIFGMIGFLWSFQYGFQVLISEWKINPPLLVSMLYMELCLDIWMWLLGFLNHYFYYILILLTAFLFIGLIGRYVNEHNLNLRIFFYYVFNIQEFRHWQYSPHVILGACAVILMQVNSVDVFVSGLVFFYRECRGQLFGFPRWFMGMLIDVAFFWVPFFLEPIILQKCARFNLKHQFYHHIIIKFLSICVAYFLAVVLNINSFGYSCVFRVLVFLFSFIMPALSNADTKMNTFINFIQFNILFPLQHVASILIWHRVFLLDSQYYQPPAQAILCALYGCVITQSFYHELLQAKVSMFPDGVFNFFEEDDKMNRILSCDWIKDFWNWLDCLQIILGISLVVLVWTQSRNALPVLAITAFVRWWGAMFYLRVDFTLHHIAPMNEHTY